MQEKEKREIEKQIQSLPKGTITTKHINGKDYEYWQFRENGKQITKRVKGEELETLSIQIKERKRLEHLLKENHSPSSEYIPTASAMTGETNLHGFIRIGDDLRRFAIGISSFKKRSIFHQLHDYIYETNNDKVFVLYGLRRTGKTTMIRQMIMDMPADMQDKTAFIQISPNETLASLNQDMLYLEKQGFRYFFIDEVTLLSDFIEGAALFSDIFVASGIKIVLSGTDSLGFLFASDEQLYDRTIMLHTTFIPYREFEKVLGISGIDQYIRYGGTMSLGDADYNKKQTPFSSKERSNEYIDSAIARNIQHSLAHYQYGGHFRALYELYEKNELTSAINRVIEDMNHRFTLDVMIRTFKSHDLGVSATNLRKDKKHPTDILDHINTEAVTERLRTLLEIRNKEEQQVQMSEEHVREIKEYLEMLDLIQDIDVKISESSGVNRKRTIFIQPGLRYAQAEALVTSLLLDENFMNLGIKERMMITERILDEIRGRMMEDIILLETKLSHPGKQVFALQFAVGEFDMVIFDPDSISCELYEIKHSKEINPQQYRHLIDAAKLQETEKEYGDITGRFVIYNGEDAVQEGVSYLNAEKYLLGLK